MEIVILGIDLGKTECSVAGLDASGRVVTRRRIKRAKLAQFLVNLPRCVVAMEACCGAHQGGRIAEHYGHEVRLMPHLAPLAPASFRASPRMNNLLRLLI